MDDSQLSEVVERRDELLKQSARLFLLEFVFRSNVAEKFAITAVFHNQKQPTGSFDDFVKLNNVRMPNYFQNVDLPRHAFDVVHISYFVFFQDLNCDLQIG